MRVLLSFVPLILFPIIAGFYSTGLGLWAAAAVAILAILADALISHRSVKLLDASQVCLFGLLALIDSLFHPAWGEASIRVIINAGLLATVLASIAAARPFTLQYAREQAPQHLWNAPAFIATNYRISRVWAGAFAVGVLADVTRMLAPAIPHSADRVAGIAALVLAARFTAWYPKHVRASLQREAPGGNQPALR